MTSPSPQISSRKVASGFGWVAVVNYSNRILGVLSTLILAKLLSPNDFGLVAIASMMLEVIQIVKDMGLSEAVIYSRRDDPVALDTAHTVLAVYNVGLFALAAGAAPLVAAFYDNPAITPVAIIMASTLVMNSLRVIPLTLIRKNLDYRSLVMPEVVPTTLASLVSIAMAFLGFGVWSLVAKALVQSALALVFLSLVPVYQPKFGFDRHAASELIHYGKFIVGSSVLLVVLYNIDRFYVSAIGIAALGTFELAMRIAELPVRQFSFLVGAVMFPVFAKMERSGSVLRPVFIKTLRYTGAITLPAAVGISVFGPRFIETIYGSRWDGIQTPLRVVALYAGLRSLSSVIYDLYKATGHPNVMQRLVFFKLVVIGGLGYPAVHAYGITGMALLITATYTLSLLWEIVELGRIIEMSAWAIARVLAGPLMTSVVVMTGVYWGFSQLGLMASIWHVAAGMMVAGLAYLGVFYAIDPEVGRDARALLAGKNLADEVA